MADIKITLELDSQQYEGSLKKVDAATNATAENAKKKAGEMGEAFDKLHEHLEKLAGKLEGITGLLAGVGFAEFIKGAMEAGTQAVEMGEKFGISTAKMLEINAAAGAAGIGGEKVANMMNKMLVSAQQASEGNLKLRDALNQLGTSTDYLRTHDASEAFDKQAHALAAMEDPARRAGLAQEIFGKAARSTNWVELAGQLDKYRDTQDQYAEAAEKAKATTIAFNTFVTELKLSVLEALEPFQPFIQAFLNSKVAIDLALGAMAGLGVIAGIIGLYKAWTMAVEAYRLVQIGANLALGAFEALCSPVVLAIAGVVAALATLYVAYEVVTGKVSSFSEGFKQLGNDIGNMAGSAFDKLTGLINKNTDALDKNKKAGHEAGAAVLTGGDRDMNAKGLADLEKMYAQMTLNNDLAVQRLETELKYVSASDAVRAAKMQEFDTDAKYQRDILAFQEKRKALMADTTRGASHSKEIAEIDQMIASLQNQKEKTAELKQAIVEGTHARQEALALEKQLQGLANERLALEEEFNDYTMTADQRKLEVLDIQLRKQIELIRARFAADQGTNDQSQWSTTAIEKYKDEVDQVTTSMGKLKDQAQKNIAQSRDFGDNWTRAMNQYQSDATNGGKIADDAFKSFTSNTEKYFESLATGGKMTFNDLMNAVITDIIKMEIKAATSSLFSMFGTPGGATSQGSGLLGAIGGLFGGGHAMGGSIPAGQIGLVGEQGPELVRGPAAVTNANQTADMMGSQTTHNYNINAIDAKSVAQLFADNRMTMFAMNEQARRELPMRTNI